MEIKELKAGVVSVEYPSRGSFFFKTFPLDEEAAIAFALAVMDHTQTGACRVHCGSGVLPMQLVQGCRDGVWVDEDNPLDC